MLDSNYTSWVEKLKLKITAAGYAEILSPAQSNESSLDTTPGQVTEATNKLAIAEASGKSLILTSICESLENLVISCATTYDMIQKLENIFLCNKETQISDLLHKFYTFTLNPKDLLTSIANLEQIVTKLARLGHKVSELEHITRILSILPEEYKFFRLSWDATPQIDRTLETLVSRLLKEQNSNNTENNLKASERECFICKSKTHIARFCPNNKNTASTHHGGGSSECRCRCNYNQSRPRDNRFCVYCKRSGHTIETCFKKNNQQTNQQIQYSKKVSNVKAVLDSGATSHMFKENKILYNVKPLNTLIGCADKQSIKAVGVGECINETCSLPNVLYVPGIAKNILSVGALCKPDTSVTFFVNHAIVQKKGKTILRANRNEHGLYIADLNAIFPETLALLAADYHTWHRRLAHTHNIENTAKIVDGININKEKVPSKLCEVCAQARLTRLPFPSIRTQATKPLQIVHSDVCGPIDTQTWDGRKYFVTFLDDYTHYSRVYLLKNKYEVSECLKHYVQWTERHFSEKVEIIRCDNGGEYCSNQLVDWCKNKGITLDYTVPYTPQLNGKAERLNRTLLDKTRALLFDANMPKYLWGEALFTAVYLLNRTSTSTKNRTPYELWNNRKPDLSNLRIFGSKVYCKINSHLGKLDRRCVIGVLVGYCQNAYIIWNPVRRRTFFSRDVAFDEEVTDYNAIIKSLDMSDLSSRSFLENFQIEPTNDIQINERTIESDSDEESLDRGNRENLIVENRISSNEERNSDGRRSREETVEGDATAVEEAEENEEEIAVEEMVVNNGSNVVEEIVEVETGVEEVRRREGFDEGITNENADRDEEFLDASQIGINMNDVSENAEANEVNVNEAELENRVEAELGVPRRNPPRKRNLPSRFNDFEVDFLAECALLTYEKAVASSEKEKWLEAIEEEKKSLEKNGTWELVDEKEAQGRKLLTSKWVFAKKADGRYKARLVARGFEQKYKVDYEETYSPVVNSVSLRSLLSIAAQKRLKLRQFDIKTAFLHGNLNEKIYMQIPKGYPDNKGKVCKLKKSLYGLKQAPLMWNIRFTEVLKKMGFSQLKSDHCLFMKITADDNAIYLAIYVDDGLLVGPSLKELDELLKILNSEFEMRVCEKVCNYVGIDVHCDEESISINQESYIEKLINKLNLQDANSRATPTILVAEHPSATSGTQLTDEYREGVGSLLYLANKTRLDIAFQVGYCSRHQNCPNENDKNNISSILRYIKGTQKLGIEYRVGIGDLVAYCDADFAGDLDTRRSTTGYVICYGGGPIAWASRKQPIVALSSTEAEYIAAAECCKELMYIQNLLRELTVSVPRTRLLVDNQSAIALMKNGVLNRRSKHIDVRYHFLKEKLDEHCFEVEFCPTDKQLADILTKSLTNVKFLRLREQLCYSINEK